MTASEARSHNIRVMREYSGGRDMDVPITELLVRKDCAICFRGQDKIVPESHIQLLSPSGVVHHAADFGMSECGHDATGEGWWWRL